MYIFKFYPYMFKYVLHIWHFDLLDNLNIKDFKQSGAGFQMHYARSPQWINSTRAPKLSLFEY